MKLFDTHCHLQARQLQPLKAVLARAAAAGVDRMLCCGTCEADWPDVARLAELPGVIPAFGIHPWYMRDRSGKWLDVLAGFLGNRAAAVGEIGIDHAVSVRNDAEQEEVFLAQWDLSVQLCRPVSMHCRKAWGRLLELLQRAGRHPVGFAIHSYSGPAELAGQLIGHGAFISFSGSITHDRNRRGRESVRIVPPDRLLLETDSPDLLPSGVVSAAAAGTPNEPANLHHVLRRIAALREEPEEFIATVTHANALRLLCGRT